jgi:pre-mRNA-splicing factor CWC26
MGSGHAAGVLTGEEFRVAEEKLRERRAAERAAMDPEASGKGAATVYRDKRGRKLDMLNEFMRIEDERAGAAREAKEQFEWGRGTKQKADEARARDELAAVAAEPFARTAADPALEASRRGAIRDGDPMADYFAARRDEAEEAARPPDAKPRYKGPTPPPNRFGIRPGYRWDGIDRGNGWENKLYKAQSEAVGRKNDRYAWSCADM